MRVVEATSMCESTRQMYMFEREREREKSMCVCVCEKEVKVGMSERMRCVWQRESSVWGKVVSERGGKWRIKWKTRNEATDEGLAIQKWEDENERNKTRNLH